MSGAKQGVSWLLGCAVALLCPAVLPAGPLTPDEERATFELADPTLAIDLVAAEPDVDSPVAICWDARGRMFVAEMRDYPLGPAAGRIRRLADRDGDGRYEDAGVFAEGLAFPNGLLAVQDGLLVTAAPDLLWFADRDDDGVAEERRVVFTGFAEGNQQLRANGLTWGLDNWIYGANGRSDGAVRRPDQPPEAAQSIRGQDFRFRMDGRFEPIAGQSQFGQTRDDWGERFLAWNTIPIRHALLTTDDVSRNPRLAARAIRNLADPNDNGQVFPRAPRPTQFNRESALFYNALCGLYVYRGDALPSGYRGNAFVGESLSSLVHRRVLEPQGPSFVSRRSEAGREFLAARDGWFHPVFFATGPDGALYVVDFYRRFVEHPQFVPADQRDSVEWREGAPHGRIWRIRPRQDWQPRPPERLDELSEDDLIARLGHANGWQRDTAQRLLVERRAAPGGAKLLAVVKHGSPLAAAHAIAVLAADGPLPGAALELVAARKEPRLSLVTLRQVAPRLDAEIPLLDWVARIADHADVPLQFGIVHTLADVDAPRATELLADCLMRWSDESLLLAADCAGPATALRLLQQLDRLDAQLLKTAARQALVRTLCAQAARAGDEGARWCLSRVVVADAPGESQPGEGAFAVLAGMAEGLAIEGRSLAQLLGSRSAAIAVAAADRALDRSGDPATRRLALDLAEQLGDAAIARRLLKLLSPANEAPLSATAARLIVARCDAELAADVFKGWTAHAVAARQALLRSAGASPVFTAALVAALEQQQVLPAELDPDERARLLALPDRALALRARALFASAIDASREEALERYAAAATLAGDPLRGGALFRQHCATCHTLLGIGTRVGPELSSVAARPADQLLVDLLDPSRQLSPDFMSYQVITDDGRAFTGLLAADTPASIVLRRGEGLEDTIPRGKIETFERTGKSLMPEGLEQRLSLQDVADLFALLAGPRPELVRP
ncbi:MAG: c-type cytochrome [Pirellulales bacterium]|nr:c-type cytochrome [Pirellulales bacterium]